MNELFTMKTSADRLEFEIAPGVLFPNWSVVTSAKTAAALDAFFEAFGAEMRWSGMTPQEDRVRRAILADYVAKGHAPTPARLRELTDLSREEVGRLLRTLNVRDLVVLGERGETIAGAYPFSEGDTGHRVHLGGNTLNAMCAIDALGAGAMFGDDTVVESSCRHCGRPVRIATGEGGRAIKSVSPENTIVWCGIQNTGGCSADTMCKVMAFFCSEDCLDSWRSANAAGTAGTRLSIDEGLQAGKAIFMPLMAAASASPMGETGVP